MKEGESGLILRTFNCYRSEKTYFILIAIFLLAAYALAWLSLPGAVMGSDDALYYVNVSWHDKIEAVVTSWLTWNGRWGELIAKTLGRSLPAFYFLVHPWFVLALCFFIYRVALSSWPLPGRCRLSVLALIMTLVSGMVRDNFLWFASNVNWLWPCLAMLAFVVILEQTVTEGFSQFPVWKRGAACALAFLSGMGNEYIAAASGVWLLVLLIAMRRRGCGNGFKFWWALSACWCAGWLMLCPGIGSRMETGCEKSSPVVLDLLFCLGWLEARWILFLAVFLVLIGRKRLLAAMRGRGSVIAVVAVLPMAAMLAAPLWGMPRSLIPLEVGFVCICALLMGATPRHFSPLPIGKSTTLIVLAFLLSLAAWAPMVLSSIESAKLLADFERQIAHFGPKSDAVVRLQEPQPKPVPVPALLRSLPRCLWRPPAGSIPWGASCKGTDDAKNEVIARIYGLNTFRCETVKRDEKTPETADSKSAYARARDN